MNFGAFERIRMLCQDNISPYFIMPQIFWKILLVTCSKSFHYIAWPIESSDSHWVSNEESYPVRPALPLKTHLNGSGPCLELYHLLALSLHLHNLSGWCLFMINFKESSKHITD